MVQYSGLNTSIIARLEPTRDELGIVFLSVGICMAVVKAYWKDIQELAPPTPVAFVHEPWCMLLATTIYTLISPKAPFSAIVDTLAFNGLPYHNLGGSVYTRKLHGAIGIIPQRRRKLQSPKLAKGS